MGETLTGRYESRVRFRGRQQPEGNAKEKHSLDSGVNPSAVWPTLNPFPTQPPTLRLQPGGHDRITEAWHHQGSCPKSGTVSNHGLKAEGSTRQGPCLGCWKVHRVTLWGVSETPHCANQKGTTGGYGASRPLPYIGEMVEEEGEGSVTWQGR